MDQMLKESFGTKVTALLSGRLGSAGKAMRAAETFVMETSPMPDTKSRVKASLSCTWRN